jgi:prepilin-type N-terminal cleavage/methylation domain-containing protein
MRKERGFTLVETMIVLVIAGIVMAMGLPAFASYRSTLAIKAARNQLNEDIRTARQFAVTRRAPVFIRFGTTSATTDLTTYTIHIDSNADGVMSTGERVIRRTMPKNTRISSASLSPSPDTLTFDISGILIPGQTGGTLIMANTKNKYDTLCVSSAGIVYRP